MDTKWILAIAAMVVVATFAACSKEEAQQPAPQDAAVEDTAEAPPVAEEEAPEAAEEAQEIVEESASEAAPEDETIKLAMADPVEAPAEWQFKEGEHYDRLVPTQPTVGGADKVEVAEFFWYGCPHCVDFEPFINRWDAEKPANARLVKIPIVWNPVAKLHGQMFYTAEILGRNGKIEDVAAFHEAVFDEYHKRSNRMSSEAAIERIFARFGVSQEDFESTWNSFEVNQQMRIANDLMRRYEIDGVPAVVVNGKYKSGGAKVGSYPRLVELIDELIVRESLR